MDMGGKSYDVICCGSVDQIVVPNGHWVLEASGYPGEGTVTFRVIGRDVERVEWHNLQGLGSHESRYLLTCQKVFGIENYLPGAEGRWFAPARQIHKGELGRTVPIALGALRQPPLVVKESKGRYAYRSQRGRHRNGWMWLEEVALAAEMAPDALIACYMPYTDHTQPRLDVVITPDSRDIRGKVLKDADWRTDDILAHAHGDYEGAPRIWSVQSWQLGRLDSMLNQVGPHVVWIRQGFGNAVLRMVAIGHLEPEPIGVNSLDLLEVEM